MKKMFFTLLIVLPFTLFSQTAKIKIYVDRTIGKIDPKIYGVFMEPSTLLMVARGSAVYSLNVADGDATPEIVIETTDKLPDTVLLIPVGLRNMMSVLDKLMEHRDYVYWGRSNTAEIIVRNMSSME